MAVVEIRKDVPFTKETIYIIWYQLGFPLAEIKKVMSPEMCNDYEKWLCKQDQEWE